MRCENCDRRTGDINPTTRLCPLCGELAATLRAAGYLAGGDVGSGRFLATAIDGATRAAIHRLTAPAASWWDDTRACLTKPAPATPCGRTRDDGTFTWRCGLNTHTGPCHDPAYGTFT